MRRAAAHGGDETTVSVRLIEALKTGVLGGGGRNGGKTDMLRGGGFGQLDDDRSVLERAAGWHVVHDGRWGGR